MNDQDFTPASVTFPDGAVWTRESPTVISYEGPRGSNRWEWTNHVDASAAWLAVCTH